MEKLTSSDGYIAAMKKTYEGKSVVIILNLSDYEKKTVDVSVYGKNLKLCDTLNVYGQSVINGSTLTMQPYSIAVLR